MLILTEAAGAHLAAILEDKNCPNDVAVRCVCEASEVSLVLDSEKPGDAAIQHEGQTVLLLDEQAADHLAGEILDVEKTEDGGRLTLTRQDAPQEE